MTPGERTSTKAEKFRALHTGEPFVLPNPWDVGSARILERLGFSALATTSSGFAFALGRSDGGAGLDAMCDHVSALDEASALPVSADLENGYGPRPEDAAEAIARVAAAGAVGGSIEDWDAENGIYGRDAAAERIEAASEAARAAGFDFVLCARAENHIRGNPDLDDTIERLLAYEAAGADVLYAPGLSSADEVRAVCDAVERPVNVLALPGLELAELFDAGAQRVSVGGALAWVAGQALADAAGRLARGDLSALASDFDEDDWL